MIRLNFKRTLFFIITSIAVAAVADEIHFTHHFSGNAGTLLNTVPADEGFGAWAAGSIINADGSINAAGVGTAALIPFQPLQGRLYSLTLKYKNTSPTQKWVSLNFSRLPLNSPGGVNPTDRFTSNGIASIYSRSESSSSRTKVEAYNGSLSSGTANKQYSGSLEFDPTRLHTLTVELDTSGSNIKAQYYANGATLLSAPAVLSGISLSDINFAGFSVNQAEGVVHQVSLTSKELVKGTTIAGVSKLYGHDFDGDSNTSLNNENMDEGTAATWAAGSPFWADGQIQASGTGSAALVPFTPLVNRIYRLSLTYKNESTDSSWVSVNFSRNPLLTPGGVNHDDRFVKNGIASLLSRSAASGSHVEAYKGGFDSGNFEGNFDRPYNDGPTDFDVGIYHTLMIELDTRGSKLNVQYYVNGAPLLDAASELKDLNIKDITYAGFSANGASAKIKNWSLVSLHAGHAGTFGKSTQLIREAFNGEETEQLNTKETDIGGKIWSAGSDILADGSVLANAIGTAALVPFTPEAGRNYTLALVYKNKSTSSWISANFSDSSLIAPAGRSNLDRFTENGITSLLSRNSPSGSDFQAFHDRAISVAFNNDIQGVNPRLSHTLSVQLDTRDSPSLFAKYVVNRKELNAATLLEGIFLSDISHVGFSVQGDTDASRPLIDLLAVSELIDVDNDDLPDEWEFANFGNLNYGCEDNPDGDEFDNIEEFVANSDPNDPQTKLTTHTTVVVDDGDPNTNELALATGSNSAAFSLSKLITRGGYQYTAYYASHPTDEYHPTHNKLLVARRLEGSTSWDVFNTNYEMWTYPQKDGETLVNGNHANGHHAKNYDGHENISFGFDGDDYMHISWGMHGDVFFYARSTAPVTNSGTITFDRINTIPGVFMPEETTYPRFYTLNNGNLLFSYRNSGSGSGDAYMVLYTTATKTWKALHTDANGNPIPFVRGKIPNNPNNDPDTSPYFQMPTMDSNGHLHLVWTWRYGNDAPNQYHRTSMQSNHDLLYAVSEDNGLTWKRRNGQTYDLPIVEKAEYGTANAEADKILPIPTGSTLMNQTGMCMDDLDVPVISTIWSPAAEKGDLRRQIMVAFPNPNDSSAEWEVRQLTFRKNEPIDELTTTESGLGRPSIVCDEDGRLIVFYSDPSRRSNLTVIHSLPRIDDPNRLIWKTIDLYTPGFSGYSTWHVDLEKWKTDKELHLFGYEFENIRVPGVPYSNNARRAAILEWDPAEYFSQ